MTSIVWVEFKLEKGGTSGMKRIAKNPSQHIKIYYHFAKR